jgi:hypothetical protein
MKSPHPEIRKLLNEINAFRTRIGMQRTRFGLEAVNDGHLLARLQSGRQPRFDTIAKVRAFMKRNGKR